MPSEHVLRIFQDFEERQGRIESAHRRIREISVTAVSPRREVSVTVDHGGTMTGLQFTGTAYRRLAPQELASLVMQTAQEARDQVLEQTAELMTPLLPPSMDARAMLRGDFKPKDLFNPVRKES